MYQEIKINQKKYWTLSLLVLLGVLAFSRSINEGLFLFLGYLLVIVNQKYFLRNLTNLFKEYFSDSTKVNKSKLTLFFLRKILFFVGIFFLSVHFLASKVIIIVVAYLLQTFVLVLAKEG